MSAPETPEEKQHKIAIMFGNGLRPQIWQQFADRFGVHRIGEFYGSTEGNSNVCKNIKLALLLIHLLLRKKYNFVLLRAVNIDSKPGAVGFSSVLFPFVYPVRLIRVSETGEALRDPDTGLVVLCQPGEPGEFVGKIVKNHPSRSFDG